MLISYEDLISGEPIYFKQVGHIKSPLLKELKPCTGIGFDKYNFYISLMLFDKEDLYDFIGSYSQRDNIVKILKKNDKLEAYDVFLLIDDLRNALLEAMRFFITEEIVYDDNKKTFITYCCNYNEDEQKYGEINRDNFEEIRDIILQLNYINLGKNAKPVRHSSKESEDAWNKVQEYLKKEKKIAKGNKNLRIGNMISKLSVTNCGYNLLNIYELTVFQLYDQFFQFGYFKAITATFGENFSIDTWLEPIIKQQE